MTNCESCGRLIPDNAVVCPNCGAATPASFSRPEQPGYRPPQSGYMPPPQGFAPPQSGYMPPPQQGYMPPQQGYVPPQQGYMPPPQQGYGQQQQQQYAPPGYQQGVNVTVVNNAGTKNNTPLIVEILLSLLGVYGVGWLMAGETTTGIVLLILSFVVYWPLLIVIAVFTLGFGLACDFPIGIAAIVINAILLNGVLNRKAAQQITVVQTR